MTAAEDFPRRRAATRGFRLGQPRTVTIGPDGTRVLFLRSAGPTDGSNNLWAAELVEGVWSERLLVDTRSLTAGQTEELPAEERAKRERLREVSGGITAYSVDEAMTVAAFIQSGELWAHDVVAGPSRPLSSATSFANATVDPLGRRVAVTSRGSVLIVDLADGSTTTLLTADSPTVSWGSAEFIAAEEMGRFAGLWWAPDGQSLLVARVDEQAVQTWWIADPAHPDREPTAERYPAAGTPNAEVSLHLVDLTGGMTEVRWDATAHEYLTSVAWEQGTDPIITIQNRPQTELVVLSVDPMTGTTTELCRQVDDRWIELIPGLPRRTARGVALGGIDNKTDTRRLVVFDDSAAAVALTPADLQLRSVAAHDDIGIVFTASEQDPSTADLWRLTWDGELSRLSTAGGWAGGTARAGTTVVAQADAAELGSRLTIHRVGVDPWTIASMAELPDLSVRIEFIADDTGWRRIAVLWPSGTHPGPLPIIMSPYGGPHAQRSIQAAGAYATEQWLADQGFCVVVADGPGAPSRPSNEYSIMRDLASGPLQGQVEALEAVRLRFGDRVDHSRVGIRGWSFGGFLAALAVMERPDMFHAAVAGAPVTDWGLYDTHYTERYLGLPEQEPEAYARSTLMTRAKGLRRPLLLVHGLADDNVVAAHTLRLSTALLSAGREHSVLPLSGVTHMTPQESVTENLLRAELTFLNQHLR